MENTIGFDLKFWGKQIWRTNCVSYDKFESATKQRKSKITHVLFLPFTGATWYYHFCTAPKKKHFDPSPPPSTKKTEKNMVLVLLSASVERFSVSCMWIFFFYFFTLTRNFLLDNLKLFAKRKHNFSLKCNFFSAWFSNYSVTPQWTFWFSKVYHE